MSATHCSKHFFYVSRPLSSAGLLFLFAAALCCLNACAGSKRYSADPQINRLVNWMIGDFSSQAQSLRDSDFFDIRLRVRRIWEREKGPGVWLYVEQATAAAQDRPYRQRVYRIARDSASGYVSEVYLLPDQQKWIGAYADVSRFDAIRPADLSPRSGCAVYLRYADDRFVGETREAACESNLRGAAYATSKVTVLRDKMVSWDQGFDAGGKQVWGAEKGGYEFVKIGRRVPR